MKKLKKRKFKINPKLKQAWDYGVAAFCVANNGAYFLGQKELIKCWTKDIYYFSKNKAKKIAILPKKQGMKIKSSFRRIPKDITNLIKKLR